MKRPLIAASVLAASVLAMAGCSQVEALAPVGGNHMTEIRYAAIDILLAKNIDVLVAPVCEQSGEAVSCTGETAEGQTITVESPADATDTVTVTVGSETIFDGKYWDILDDAVRGDL
ncbi:MAG TPA: hypothetical protein DEA59_07675 [Microbacterium sp.]|nr:hypothetical protein [Microbacterium sp.]HBR89134.1 hypothetical protein [Microbacterium sp.]